MSTLEQQLLRPVPGPPGLVSIDTIAPPADASREVRLHRVPAPGRSSVLRRVLVACDAISAFSGWLLGLLVSDGLFVAARARTVATIAVPLGLGLLTLAAIAAQRLYLARTCAVRSVEISRLGRAVAGAAIAALLLPRALPSVGISVAAVTSGALASFVLLMTARGLYRHWLQAGRRNGRYLRDVIVVGANDEAAELATLLRDHPELGLRVVGFVGQPADDGLFPASVRRLGPIDGAAAAVAASGANGVLVAASALSAVALNLVVRDLLRAGVHVQLSSGLRGFDHRRLRSLPLAHEPLFYLEPLALAPWQLTVKRALDLTVASVASVVAAPLILLAAIAIRLDDGGPVFFRQRRPGRDLEPFSILKLRTMRVGADAGEPLAIDPRQGPRSKRLDDPRRTRVGRILERTSIDELPQLWNVLRGDMSIVGPRPALMHEAAKFDDELKARFTVRPGMTGLWQVEARDNPSFAAYRRYDLFYIENWSLGLDVAVLVATAQAVLIRSVGLLRSSRRAARGPVAVVAAADHSG